MSTQHFTHVTIGNSAAAVAAIIAIRASGDTRPLAVVSEEPGPAYARHLISYLLTTGKTAADISFRPVEFYLENAVQTFCGVRAERIDWVRKSVLLNDGATLTYTNLLLATGSRPIVPPLPGRELAGIYTFTTMAQALALHHALPTVRQVVVVGGGLIGLQVAEALAKAGKQVTVVELAARLLAPVLDAPAAALVAERLQAQGIALRLHVAATALLPAATNPQAVGAVQLATGELLPADAVVLAVGVAPRTELVQGSDIKVARGILVDAQMQTSLPHVFAAGDVAAGPELTSSTCRPVPVWSNAFLQGYAAGTAMAGRPQPAVPALMMNSAHFSGLPVVSAGLYDPPVDAPCEVVSYGPDTDGCYRKLVMRAGHLVGLVATGAGVDGSGLICGLIRNRTRLSPSQAERLLERADLIALPPEIRRSYLAGGYNPNANIQMPHEVERKLA